MPSEESFTGGRKYPACLEADALVPLEPHRECWRQCSYGPKSMGTENQHTKCDKMLRDAYNGLANFPVSQPGVREHFCNYCVTRISTVYQADVRPSRALTMERLADLRSSHVPSGSGPTLPSRFLGRIR